MIDPPHSTNRSVKKVSFVIWVTNVDGDKAFRVFICGAGKKNIAGLSFSPHAPLSLHAENCGSRGATASVVIGWHRITSLTHPR